MTIEDWPLNVRFRPDKAGLSLYAEVRASKSSAPAYAIIQRIAKRFDTELAKGQYQSEFGGYDRKK